MEGLVGTWRLLSFESRRSDGRVDQPFGPDAGGLIIYAPDGWMSAALWQAGRRPFAAGDQTRGTPEETAAAIATYVAYTGPYEVDEAAGEVHHHVEQSVFPNWNGTTQTRRFALTEGGRRLELTAPAIRFGGVDTVPALVWERAALA
jgi:hypothetical protein